MLVKCKACGKEIGKGVKKCVHCGSDQRNWFSKHKILTGILVIFVIAGISLAADGGGKVTTTAPSPAGNKSTMTMGEFNQLKDGMSYEEATAIIGGPGEVMSESGSPGDDAHTVMYTYKGEGDLGANSNLMFQGDKLMNKAQMGLK